MAGSLNGNSASGASGGAAGGGGSGAGHDDFFDQMLSSLPSSWPDLANHKSPWEMSSASNPSSTSQESGYNDSALLAMRLQQHQISGNGLGPTHQMLMSLAGRSPAAGGDGGGGSGDLSLFPLPLSLGSAGTGAEGLYNGYGGELQNAAQAAAEQPFHHSQGGSMPGQNYGGAPASGGSPASPLAAALSGSGTAAGPPKQRVRARRGQATDPHSIAERLRRERIAERMKALQELVPNANKTDKASMLDEIIDYVKFLQLQVKVLSMSRLGGAAAVAPLVANMSSEGQSTANGAGTNDSLTVTEQQVAKLMEEDMGSAMQYLQGKGLCLMPISLASAISSSAATCHPSRHLIPPPVPPISNCHVALDRPASPGLSVLTNQSALANGSADGGSDVCRSHKDATAA